MKRYKSGILNCIALCCAWVLAVGPAIAIAQDTPDQDVVASPVVLTFVQTGAATASDERIELYNRSEEPVDITGWQVRYQNAGANSDSALLVTIDAVDGQPVVLPSHTAYTLHTPSVTVDEGLMAQTYTAGLSKTDKTVALFAPDQTPCMLTVQDAVAWNSGQALTQGEGQPVTVPSDQIGKDKLLRRQQSPTGEYLDTNNNVQDFMLNDGMPAEGPEVAGSLSALLAVPMADCSVLPPAEEPQPPVEPTPEQGPEALAPPIITELLPNPGSPLSDADDEFIELYNPNDVALDLGGYGLEVGLTTKHRYVFVAGTQLEPQSYRAFLSAETNLALSNTGSQVWLLDPDGSVVSDTTLYQAAGENKAWALANEEWQWTITPTPGAANTISAPPSDAPQAPEVPATGSNGGEVLGDTANRNAGLQAPQVSELLPDPAAPQTDSDDEFIELYNPNDESFALGGYMLEVGTTTKHHYVLPEDTSIQPHTYLAFTSAQTGLALSNTSGQARLLSPSGIVLSQGDAYTSAKSGLVWALISGTWQWSAKPTPGAANVASLPVAKAKASTAKAKTSKAVKTTKAKAPATAKAAQSTVASVAERDPLHPSVLAAVAGLAVLYGAYEYRRDVANKIYQFRSNRAARAAARQSAQRR